LKSEGLGRPLRVLWLGPWHSDQALYGRKAVNQAATLWSRGLLRGLAKQGCAIRVCTHCREQFWPKGGFWPGRPGDFDQTYPLRTSSYANVPLLRDTWLAAAYKRMLVEEIEACQPDVVLAYNLAPYHCAVSEPLAARKVKWVPIILDQDDPEEDRWETFARQARGASGLIFLSDWGWRHCPVDLPRLHLDGGAERWRGDENVEEGGKRVVYSGKFDDRYGGLDALFKIFAEVKDPACRFLLTGKDAKNRLAAYLRQEPRAEYCGFLDEYALHELHRRASVFVNPRPPSVSDNRMTFPSKLIHYLSYGKPVISTWTDGLAPEYLKLLHLSETQEPVGYAALIEKALAASVESRLVGLQQMERWIKETHTWDIQAARLVQWVRESVVA